MVLTFKNQILRLPLNVSLIIKNKKIIISGPYGTLAYFLPFYFSLKKIKKNQYDLIRKSSCKKVIQLEALLFSLINNMIIGVSQTFIKRLEINGTGYKFELKDNYLFLHLSFNIPIQIKIPKAIKVLSITPTKIEIKGLDKEKVFGFAAFIRSKKKLEPYKGKGIFYENETIRLRKVKH